MQEISILPTMQICPFFNYKNIYSWCINAVKTCYQSVMNYLVTLLNCVKYWSIVMREGSVHILTQKANDRDTGVSFLDIK